MGRALGFAVAAFSMASAGCGLPPDQTEGEPPADVETSQGAVSVCNQFGMPDPGTCSSCAQDSAGNWKQTCVTIECNLAQRSCTPPIVSCGSCGYRYLVGYVQLCTRADGSQLWQSCTPPQLPQPPGGFPRVPLLP
jgi:hypothetical protein